MAWDVPSEPPALLLASCQLPERPTLRSAAPRALQLPAGKGPRLLAVPRHSRNMVVSPGLQTAVHAGLSDLRLKVRTARSALAPSCWLLLAASWPSGGPRTSLGAGWGRAFCCCLFLNFSNADLACMAN